MNHVDKLTLENLTANHLFWGNPAKNRGIQPWTLAISLMWERENPVFLPNHYSWALSIWGPWSWITDAATGQALQSLLAMSKMIPPLSSVCTDQSLWPWSSSFSFILVSSSLICPKEKSTESYQWPHLHPRWQAKRALWYGSGPSLYTYSRLRLWRPELGKLVTNMKQSACNKFKWKNELWWAMGSSTEGL